MFFLLNLYQIYYSLLLFPFFSRYLFDSNQQDEEENLYSYIYIHTQYKHVFKIK